MRRKSCLIGVLCLFSVLIYSCSNWGGSETEDPSFTYHITEHQRIEDTVYSTELYDEYRYIVLETDGKNFVGDIKQMEVNALGIFLHSNKMIFRFDMDGKLKYVINRIGKGPGEYVGIHNFSLDGERELYIYDNSQYRLIVFDQESGDFLRTVTVPYSVKSIFIHNNDFYINRWQLKIKDFVGDDQILAGKGFDFEKFESYFPVSPSSNFISMYELYSFADRMYWIDFMNNKLYTLDKGKFVPYIHYDFGPRNVPSELGENPQLSQLKDYTYSYNRPYENDKYAIGMVLEGSSFNTMIFDKKTGSNKIYANIHNRNYYSNPVVHSVYDNYFYKAVPAWEVIFMKSYAKENPSPGPLSSVLSAQLEPVAANDNPVIAVFNLK